MTNPHLEGLVRRLDNRYATDLVGMTASQWIETNTRLKKKPFSFLDYHFQRAIADDMHANLSVRKCSQVGLTEVQLRKILAFLVRNNGVKAIFTLPNEKMFKRISKTRIQTLVKADPVFNPEGSADWTRSMDLMQFDQSFLYVTGATEGDATSIDADAVFNDEVDLTDQSMLALFASRMQNSLWRLSQQFSTLTHVGYGIDKSTGASDQKEYMCKCHACNHWNIPEFDRAFTDIPGLPDHVADLSQIDEKVIGKLDLNNAAIVCERCRAPLDLSNPDVREWVPRFPDRSQTAGGYIVAPFVTSKLDVQYIITQLLQYKQRDYIRGWHNTVLGKPFTDSNARLTEAAIKANFVHPAPLPFDSTEPLLIGIDVGLLCHIVIGKLIPGGVAVAQFLTINAEQIEEWSREFCEEHNVIGGGMDRFPYTPTATAVFEASKGKIFPVEYRGARELNPIKNETDDIIYFQANRTQLLDEVVKRVRKGKLPMAGYDHYQHIVIEHLRDMVRDEQPEQEAKWIKLNGNDHYFHAIGFLLFGARINEVIESMSDADIRTMISVMGVDVSSSKDALFRSGAQSTDQLYGRPDGLVSRFNHSRR